MTTSFTIEFAKKPTMKQRQEALDKVNEWAKTKNMRVVDIDFPFKDSDMWFSLNTDSASLKADMFGLSGVVNYSNL